MKIHPHHVSKYSAHTFFHSSHMIMTGHVKVNAFKQLKRTI